MNELIQLALSTKAALRVLEEELEAVCKNKQLPLKERVDALVALGQIGGGHSDWVFSGWYSINDQIIENTYFERRSSYELFELLNSHVHDSRPDLEDRLEAYYAGLPEGTYGDAIDFLLYTVEDLQTIELVEAMCDNATLSFTYDW